MNTTNSRPYRLSEEIRNFIITQKQHQVSPKSIKDKIQGKFRRSVSYSTIRNTWARFLRTGSIEYQQPAGRPPALSEREQRHLVRDFVTHPGKSIRTTVSQQGERPISRKPVSRRTIRRVLRRRSLKPRITNRGTEITPKNKTKRLKFAQSVAHWTGEDWGKIVFSDEATIFPQRTITRVIWSQKGSARSTSYEESFQQKSINVWGFVKYDGTVEIFRFEETMKQDKYLNMLKEHLDDAIRPTRRCDPKLIFMQDNASYHKANSVIKWLRENRKNFITWPPQSPDLSPMENIWASLKNELWNQRERITSSNDVWVLSREIVHNFTLVYIHNLYHSMPERNQKVIENQGDRISHT